MLGTSQAWFHFHLSHRKFNNATTFVNYVRRIFIFYCCMPLDNINFSSPTTERFDFFKQCVA